MDCMVGTTHGVVPVFYHVDPSDVRRQSGSFRISFDEHEEKTQKMIGQQKEQYLVEVQNWKDSMTKIANRAGVVVHSSEADSIKRITNLILEMLDRPKLLPPDLLTNLVDMTDRLFSIENLIDVKSNNVCLVGIVGMGGIGKTTIAQVFYKKFARKFDWSCFLHISSSHLLSLQNQLLCGLGLKKEIWDEDLGAKIIKNLLRVRKVFIVLDGVEDKWQLEKLAGSPNWFGPKSVVLITTRNKDILRRPNYKGKIKEYNVELLSDGSAFELFCKHAFKGGHIDENFMHLTWEILERVKGHPLALIKIGSFLYGRSIDIWEFQLKNNFYDILVREYLFSKILRTSYDELDAYDRNLLLDLACFFNGERVERVTEILESLSYTPTDYVLRLLVDRCLIDISYGRIQMHFLILCMSQAIAQGKLGTQGNQTRIWLREDVRRVFLEKTGLHEIQGIVDLGEEEELALEAESFQYMTALRILEIDNVKLDGDVKFLSNQLRLLNWSGYPSEYLPSTFQSRSLLKLHLHGSNLRLLWEDRKTFLNLKEIDVSGSKFLVETPDFLGVPNLQRLILRNCERLQYIHPSINILNHLVLLDLEGCVNLRRISDNISCKGLQNLILSNSGFERFPEMVDMECLTELHLNGTVIDELHPSIERLTHLVLLNLRNCTSLFCLPIEIGSLSSLKTLILNGCKNLHQIPLTLGDVESLEKLDIGRTSIDRAPMFIHILRNLKILNCERLSSNIWCSLTALFKNSLSNIRDLNLSDCNLEDIDIPRDLHCFSELEILDLSGNHFIRLSGSLGQLINLKALYLNDCNKLKQLSKLPVSCRYVGLRGMKSLDMSPNPNPEGSSTSISSSLLSHRSRMKKVDDLAEEVAEKEYSPQADTINKMEMPISHLWHSKLAAASNKNLVGVEYQLEKVHKLLDLGRKDVVLFLGIFGTSGIGKTGIAKVVYHTIADKFESSCFLQISNQSNLISLQHQLLSQLLSKEDFKIWDKDFGVEIIKNYVGGRKVLIILDGVDEESQIKKLVGLAGSPDWFKPGSRVIVTARDRQVLVHQPSYRDKIIEYNVALLDDANAIRLFCNHAFKSDNPDDNLKDLCDEIVGKLEGLPLALKVIGSFLCNKDFAAWEDTLMRLNKVEQDFLDTILQRS